MRRNAVDLDRFYASRQGRTAQTMIMRRLEALWPDVRDLDMLGLGFTTPFLERYQASARRCISFLPAGQGAVISGETSPPSAMGDETRLPFMDAVFDRILVVHALEEADSLRPLLREIWRVMAPGGRMVIVTSARAGVWAHMDATPFGHGRPFSRGQLTQLLHDALFEPAAWSRALYAPPWRWSTWPRLAQAWEKAGETAWPGLGGVILVEAVKRNAALTPRDRKPGIRRRALEGAPAGALSPRHKDQDRSTEEDDLQ